MTTGKSWNRRIWDVLTGQDDDSAGPVYGEDAAHGTGDEGFQILAVRNDTLAALVDADGDYAPLQVDENGAVYVGKEQKNLVGTQSTSNTSQSAQDINPSTNGVSESRCDIVVQNTGSETFWVNASSASAVGEKLKPGQSRVFEDHDSADGALQIYPDTTNGHTAEMVFYE